MSITLRDAVRFWASIAVPIMVSGGFVKGADDLKFEVAALKRVGRCTMHNSIDPGMVSFEGDPLRVLLSEAFEVKFDQISGPSWLDTDCFTLTAKLPEGARRDQIPVMLRTLLAERLKLSSHKETRSKPGYELVVDKNGPKVKLADLKSNPANAGKVTFGMGGKALIKGAMTMAFLARNLSTELGAPVTDLTGMKGIYDVNLTWEADLNAGNVQDQSGTGVFTAIRELLGLRLEPHKEDVDIVVIDQIERLDEADN